MDPIALDRSLGCEWQGELAELDGPRLERCLREIDELTVLVAPPARGDPSDR